MSDPPRLVLEAPSGDPDRDDADHHQQAVRDERGEHVRIRADELEELVEESGGVELRVAPDDEGDVGGDQPDGPGAQAAVPPDELVLAHRALEPGDAGHQQHQHQQQVAADEAAEATGGGQPAAGRRQGPPALAGDDEGHDRSEAKSGECGAAVREAGQRRMPGPMGRSAPG